MIIFIKTSTNKTVAIPADTANIKPIPIAPKMVGAEKAIKKEIPERRRRAKNQKRRSFCDVFDNIFVIYLYF